MLSEKVRWIVPGTPLRIGGDVLVTSGALARDEADILYILTVVNDTTARERRVLLADSELFEVGTLLGSSEDQDGEVRPLASAIGRIRIDEGIYPGEGVSGGSSFWPRSVAALDRLLGVPVRKSGSKIATGHVRATHGLVTISRPKNGPPQQYFDTVEVTFQSADAIQRGDAGCLVVTETGDAVGLMVAGSFERCYVAPLEPYLKRTGLELWAPLGSQWSDLPARVGWLKEQARDTDLDLGTPPEAKSDGLY